jgi:hypothetical protein
VRVLVDGEIAGAAMAGVVSSSRPIRGARPGPPGSDASGAHRRRWRDRPGLQGGAVDRQHFAPALLDQPPDGVVCALAGVTQFGGEHARVGHRSAPLAWARRTGPHAASLAPSVAELHRRLLRGLAVAARPDLDTGATLVVEAGSHAVTVGGASPSTSQARVFPPHGADRRLLRASPGFVPVNGLCVQWR